MKKAFTFLSNEESDYVHAVRAISETNFDRLLLYCKNNDIHPNNVEGGKGSPL